MSYKLFFGSSSSDDDEVMSEFTEFAWNAYQAAQPKVPRRGIPGISPLVKCTAVAATTSSECLRKFCNVIMKLYGAEFLRKPMYSDLERLYAHDDHKHGFPRMMGSIDCTSWEWENCLNGLRDQYAKGDHGSHPFILLEAVASQDLWIWHAFFGVSGMNNDINVLHRSPIFNDIISGRAPDLEFEANDVRYKRGYYLTDGIYLQWFVLIMSISNPPTGDEKRILYKRKHEAARKDVERAFDVLKNKWKMLKVSARGLYKQDLQDIIYTCIILHNMIIRHKQRAICPTWFEYEGHRDHDPLRTHEESLVVTQELQDVSTHLHLKYDLIERIWRNRRNQVNQENEDEDDIDDDEEEDDEEFL